MSQKQLIDRIRVAIKRVQVTGAEKRQKWCELILDHVQSANTLPRWQKVWPKAPQELTLFACRCGDVVLMQHLLLYQALVNKNNNKSVQFFWNQAVNSYPLTVAAYQSRNQEMISLVNVLFPVGEDKTKEAKLHALYGGPHVLRKLTLAGQKPKISKIKDPVVRNYLLLEDHRRWQTEQDKAYFKKQIAEYHKGWKVYRDMPDLNIDE